MAAEKFNIYNAMREWRKDKRLTCYHRDFLNLVTELMNAAYWKQPFVLFSTEYALDELGISKPTFIKIRRELVEYGWMEYKEGIQGHRNASYRAKDSKDGNLVYLQDSSVGKLALPTDGNVVYPFNKKNKELLKEGGEAASVGQEDFSLGAETLTP